MYRSVLTRSGPPFHPVLCRAVSFGHTDLTHNIHTVSVRHPSPLCTVVGKVSTNYLQLFMTLPNYAK